LVREYLFSTTIAKTQADALVNSAPSKVIVGAESIRFFNLLRVGDPDRVVTLPNGINARIFALVNKEEREGAKAVFGILVGVLFISGVGCLANASALVYVTDRVSLYHAVDSLLMTSDFEGTPMTLLETMSSGVPVVASAVDGIAEVCTHGKNALLSPPGDLGSFWDSLCRLFAEESLRETLGAEGRRTVIQNYDIRGIARRIEGIYGEVLGGN
jgi:hypothetical protein